MRRAVGGILIECGRQGDVLRVHVPELLLRQERMVRLLKGDLHAERRLARAVDELHRLADRPDFLRVLVRQPGRRRILFD
jgi:hypothetical protein